MITAGVRCPCDPTASCTMPHCSLCRGKMRHGAMLLGGQGSTTAHAHSYGGVSPLIRHDSGGTHCGDFCVPFPLVRTALGEGRVFRPHLSADTPSDPVRADGPARQKSSCHLCPSDSRGSDTCLARPWGQAIWNHALCSAQGLVRSSLRILDPGGQVIHSSAMGPIARACPLLPYILDLR